jgi:hypothetical protein
VCKVRQNTANTHSMLEKVLADGVEARSFVRDCGPLITVIDGQIAVARELIDRLEAGEAKSEALATELRRLEQELRLLEEQTAAIRNLLAEAVARASEHPRPVDWERVRAAEEAYGRGETNLFSTR